jgi:Zyg-11 family protein
VILEEGGLDLFLDVLVTFQDDCAVENLVLIIFKNIAEVTSLRPCLMLPEFMTRLR